MTSWLNFMSGLDDVFHAPTASGWERMGFPPVPDPMDRIVYAFLFECYGLCSRELVNELWDADYPEETVWPHLGRLAELGLAVVDQDGRWRALPPGGRDEPGR